MSSSSEAQKHMCFTTYICFFSDSTSQDSSLKNCCKKCGVEFPTLKQLVEHGKAEHGNAKHGRARKRTSWSMPGDSYPTQCEHNTTKLQLHMLRHSPPSVPCAVCGRAFHDKYALARHAAAHESARPHRCHVCPRAFKKPGNLVRHHRVHTGATPYECSICDKKFKYSTSRNLHVRTVHYKLPLPPRKKRCKARAKADEGDTEAK